MCDNFQGHPSSKSLSRPAVKNSPLLKWKYHPFVQNSREREREREQMQQENLVSNRISFTKAAFQSQKGKIYFLFKSYWKVYLKY